MEVSLARIYAFNGSLKPVPQKGVTQTHTHKQTGVWKKAKSSLSSPLFLFILLFFRLSSSQISLAFDS